jgi:hypothetical protein
VKNLALAGVGRLYVVDDPETQRLRLKGLAVSLDAYARELNPHIEVSSYIVFRTRWVRCALGDGGDTGRLSADFSNGGPQLFSNRSHRLGHPHASSA